MAEHALAGHTLADRYDLLALLGTGGMGAVYRAHDRELDELVALKVIKPELSQDPVMVDRFRHEVKLARRVTHVNVARTFELGHADGFMYCTMELVDGESLRGRLARGGKLAIADAAAKGSFSALRLHRLSRPVAERQGAPGGAPFAWIHVPPGAG
jgi:serine/threonine protein kinase